MKPSSSPAKFSPSSRIAVVIGMCAHGLAIARSLHRAGIPVVGLEARDSVPGIRTSCAAIARVHDINGPGLIEDLIALAPKFTKDTGKPVLFTTNDRMVEQIAQRIDAIADAYSISWARSAGSIRKLLRKDEIEARCRLTGHDYPKTLTFMSTRIVREDLAKFRFPIILKPVQPLGRFKTAVVDSMAELAQTLDRLGDQLPILAQEFIPGDDTEIRFGALMLDEGEVRARFEGRKLRSRPMGHTTIAISEPDDAVHRLAVRFFEGLGLSGPVSLEVKRDATGRDWVIEPTVGRTDFWVGLTVANGVNLLEIEYQIACGGRISRAVQATHRGWVNGERDPAALFWLLGNAPAVLASRRWNGVYLDRQDWRPFVAHAADVTKGIPHRISRRVRRLLSGR